MKEIRIALGKEQWEAFKESKLAEKVKEKGSWAGFIWYANNEIREVTLSIYIPLSEWNEPRNANLRQELEQIQQNCPIQIPEKRSGNYGKECTKGKENQHKRKRRINMPIVITRTGNMNPQFQPYTDEQKEAAWAQIFNNWIEKHPEEFRESVNQVVDNRGGYK